MALISRRAVLAAGGTLAAASWPRKPRAQEELDDLARSLTRVNPPKPAPAIVFLDAQGEKHRLSEFRGHGMVINLWATWCAPCVAEMPSLAALSKAVAPSDIAVLPLSSDNGGVTAVTAFFRKHAITGLPILLDPEGDAEHVFRVRGIPTSFVIDKAGMLRGRLEGPADWSAPAAVQLVRQLAGA